MENNYQEQVKHYVNYGFKYNEYEDVSKKDTIGARIIYNHIWHIAKPLIDEDKVVNKYATIQLVKAVIVVYARALNANIQPNECLNDIIEEYKQLAEQTFNKNIKLKQTKTMIISKTQKKTKLMNINMDELNEAEILETKYQVAMTMLDQLVQRACIIQSAINDAAGIPANDYENADYDTANKLINSIRYNLCQVSNAIKDVELTASTFALRNKANIEDKKYQEILCYYYGKKDVEK